MSEEDLAILNADLVLCNNQDAFQSKTGKLLLAWIIIAAAKCI